MIVKAVRRLGTEESGIALLMALGSMIVLAIMVATSTLLTTASTRSATMSGDRLQSVVDAESGENAALSLVAQTLAKGANPAAANLLGCAGASGASDTNGPSNCAAPTPFVVCLNGTSTCTAGSAQSASVWGYYGGTTGGTYLSHAVPPSTWLLVSDGYAYAPSIAAVVVHRSYAEVKVAGVTSGAVAAVWNHIFLTAPLVPNQCQTTFAGNSLTIDVPLYVIGNLCLPGNSDAIREIGQPVDLQVGGKLVLSGNSTSVGANATTPITSGVVVGGCTIVSASSTTTPCAPAGFNYWVRSTDTFSSQAAPSETAADILNKYNTFDPGPHHPCQPATNPASLQNATFDTDTAYNNSASSFELTPNVSYSCLSQSGAAVGQLSWDNTAKKLTINGSIFIDGSITVSQSLYYVGTANIEFSGTFTINNNSTTICATNPCDTSLSAWQGTSGNNSMLTLAALASNTTAVTMGGNSQIFQGSLWTQPSSSVLISGNSITVEGPLSIGSLNLTVNSTSLKPLPVIANMPVGAPIPPNTGATLGPLTLVG